MYIKDDEGKAHILKMKYENFGRKISVWWSGYMYDNNIKIVHTQTLIQGLNYTGSEHGPLIFCELDN
jgi:hypothetical protein